MTTGEDWITFGSRLRQIRVRAGISIREAAVKANVDKNTILRLETGKPVRKKTMQRICDSYGVLSATDLHATTGAESGVGFASARAGSGTWFRMKLVADHEPSLVSTSGEIQQPEERHRLGALGFASQFLKKVPCQLADGQLKAAILEVYGKSGYAAQASGEAFVYCFQGTVRFIIGEEQCILEQGDFLVFDRTIRHMHEAIGNPKHGPALLLYVQAD